MNNLEKLLQLQMELELLQAQMGKIVEKIEDCKKRYNHIKHQIEVEKQL